MNVGPYLFFEDKCGEAMDFYKSCFGGELFKMTYKQAQGEKCPPELENRMMHAALKSGGLLLLASDCDLKTKIKPGTTVSLNLNCDSEEHVDEAFKKLSAGGTVMQEPHQAFWGARFAVCTDKYGFSWMLNYDKPKA